MKNKKKCEKSLQTPKKSDIKQIQMFKNYFTSDEAEVGKIMKKSDCQDPSLTHSKKAESVKILKTFSKVSSLMNIFEKKVVSTPENSDQSEESK